MGPLRIKYWQLIEENIFNRSDILLVFMTWECSQRVLLGIQSIKCVTESKFCVKKLYFAFTSGMLTYQYFSIN